MAESQTNLLDETLESLADHGKSPQEVLWVGASNGTHAVPWDEFVALAADFEYDDDYGPVEVPEDLVVVGAGWWLERYNYDGQENWVFKSPPQRRSDASPFKLKRFQSRVSA